MNPNVTTFFANGSAHRDGRGHFRVNWPTQTVSGGGDVIKVSPPCKLETGADPAGNNGASLPPETGLLFDL